MDNTSDRVKGRPETRRRERKKDYSPQKASIANTLFENQRILITKYNIRYTSFRELYEIFIRYISGNKPVSPYELHLYLGSTGSYPALYQRLGTLKKRGLIRSENRRYYPTDQAIRELTELLKSAS